MTPVRLHNVSAPVSQAGDDVPRGILYMTAATLLLALSGATAKWLVATYPVGEVMFARSFSSLLLCSALILPITGLSVFATNRPRGHLARGLSQSVSQTFTVVALGLMPMAGAMAIGFSAPLWAALIAILWFREGADVTRWTVLLTGFLGVLMVTQPGVDTLQIGALFALANAIMYGGVTVAVRGMTKTESAYTLLMWQMAIMAVCHACLLPFGARWPAAPMDTALLVSGGVTNAGGQYFWTKALLVAPATAVSPFYYLMLVWGIILGFLVWGEVPTDALLIGAGIVIASGLILLWHEAKLQRAARAATPTNPITNDDAPAWRLTAPLGDTVPAAQTSGEHRPLRRTRGA